MNNLEEFLRLIGKESLGAEVNDGWEKWVCEPIVRYPIAPRAAKAALEILGFLSAYGVDINNILYNVADKEFHRLGMKEEIKQLKPKLPRRKIRREEKKL